MKKLTSAILSALLVLTAIAAVFTVPASAAETVWTPTAENLGTLFVPVKKNPFVTDKLELTDGTFTDSDNWNGFPSEKCLFGLPLGTANVGVTFRAPKAGKINIKVAAYKQNDNGTEVRIGIGINAKHYGENDVTEPITREKREKTFTYTVAKDDVIAIIVTLPNGGDGGNTFFAPEISYTEEQSGGENNPETADIISAVVIVAAASCAVVSKKKKR